MQQLRHSGGGGGKPLCFGDLGLLADLLVQNVPYKPIYDMGICPHGADRNSEIIDKIHKANPNSIILNTTGSPIEFLKKMKQCKTILSTGLHPLIAADSMGIPNLWGRISEIPTYHKFKDYYSVFNIEEELEPYYLDTNSITPDFIIDKYKLTSLIVEQVKQKLYDVHKKFFEEHKFN